MLVCSPPHTFTLQPIFPLLLVLLRVLVVVVVVLLLLLLVLHHATHGREHGLLLLYELHLLVEHCVLLHLMEAHGREDHHGVVLLLVLVLRVDVWGVQAIAQRGPHFPAADATVATVATVATRTKEVLLELMVVGRVHCPIPPRTPIAVGTIGRHLHGGRGGSAPAVPTPVHTRAPRRGGLIGGSIHCILPNNPPIPIPIPALIPAFLPVLTHLPPPFPVVAIPVSLPVGAAGSAHG